MALKEYFPYCQVFHALAARATRDHRFLEQKEALQLAAVYAADRAVLKQAMVDDAMPVGRSLPPFLNITPGNTTVSERFIADEHFPDEPILTEVAGHEAVKADPNGSVLLQHESDITKARQTDAGTLNFQHKAQQLQAEAAAAEDSVSAEASDVVSATVSAEAATPAVGIAEAVASMPADTVAPVTASPELSNPARTDETSAAADLPEVEMNVADQVINDLERLNQLKHNFEALFEANKASILLRDAARTVGVTPADDLNLIQQARQKRIAELVSSLDPELNGQVGELEYGVGDKNILEEIKNNKEALEPENQKQKDQLQMIDDFINIQPNLAKDKLSNAPEDLSTIKTGEFSDKVVSETLVNILIKQGKKDKAVEVLKKLIWKFPQKKAYFAAQIEDLKK